MNYNNAVFEAAFGTAEQLPSSDCPEICFSGRSNVGKSSLINRLLSRKRLAFVSTKPGKTATVNFYRLGSVRLVDLPGYGYAKVSGSQRMRWAELMEAYFNSGRNIKMTFQLIDMRHEPTDFDMDMIRFLRDSHIPFTIVMTKCDKLNKTEYAAALARAGELFGNAKYIPFSAVDGSGTEELRALIEGVVSGG